MTTIIILLLALAVGLTTGILIGRNQGIRSASAENERRVADILAQQEEREKLIKEHHEQDMLNRQAHFDESMARITAEMKAATEEMLKQRQKEFADTTGSSLSQIVTPLRDTIDKMKKAIDDNTLKNTSISSEMKVNLQQMMQQCEAAQKSTDELTRLFKHGSKVQGDWGETVLDELLKSQGLTPGIHYHTQSTIRDAAGNVVKNDNGGILRPDVILHLDDQRQLIIDSKVSLSAFMDYVNAENESDRQRALKLHVESIRKHVQELADKDYSTYVQPPQISMDYVIMFVPHSAALWVALNAQPDLWRRAMEKNVFIADEQTLFAALRIVNLTWKQIQQAENHERVYALAHEMLDRVGQFHKRYLSIGKALENAQRAYEEAERKLQPSGQSIINSANKLIKLGAKQSDKNPIPLITQEDDVCRTQE